MKNIKRIFKTSFALLLIFTVISCGNNSKEKNESQEIEEEGGEVSNFVMLNQKQLEVMNIELGAIEKVNLGNTLKVNGQLELPPQNMASVSALLGGRVKSVAVIEGDYIKKGQVIAQLENPEFIALQQKYLSLKSSLSF